jgi:hypothetical protein
MTSDVYLRRVLEAACGLGLATAAELRAASRGPTVSTSAAVRVALGAGLLEPWARPSRRGRRGRIRTRYAITEAGIGWLVAGGSAWAPGYEKEERSDEREARYTLAI